MLKKGDTHCVYNALDGLRDENHKLSGQFMETGEISKIWDINNKHTAAARDTFR